MLLGIILDYGDSHVWVRPALDLVPNAKDQLVGLSHGIHKLYRK